MREKKSKVVLVVGQGYVGLPLSRLAWEAGFEVVGLDTNLAKIADLKSGLSPIQDISSEEISEMLASGRYLLESDYAALKTFDIAVITVPTPLRDGKPDLSFIESATESLGRLLKRGALVILESTTYPGTTDQVVVPILERISNLSVPADFRVGYSPERIDPGNKNWTLANTPKIVSGIDELSLEAVSAFYTALGITVVPVSGTREAEMTKLLENTFRHVNIALVNELAIFSTMLGVDIWESIRAAATKPFGFMSFSPGPGVGGHCLPVDPSYLSWAIEETTGESFKFVELANAINNHMPFIVTEKVASLVGPRVPSLPPPSILLVGLAYKPNTSDVRESPAIRIGEMLAGKGYDLIGIDNLVSDHDWPDFIVRHRNFVGKYDIGVVITPHSGSDWVTLQRTCKRILDTGNIIQGENVVRL